MTPAIIPTSLKAKRVLITGGTSGIGRALAARLAGEGCRVFICSRKADRLAEALESLTSEGAEVSGIVADLATTDGILQMFREADAFLGHLDIAVMNAGVPSKGELEDMSHEEWRYVIAVNLMSAIGCCREAVPRMTGRGGHLVITGSMSVDVLDTRASVYVTAKAGLRAFAATLRKELNPNGIKVSVIEPGSVASDMVDETEPEKEDRICRGLMLRPEEVAEAIRFMLVQPQGSDIIKMQIKPRLQLI